ncbi:DUF6694 family lipoprotein [Endomicrobium proavitum]|uniref:Lipoprotein n=1 Tax=Endomicrobium proavitum TaxID=1408281 RepID=A0A0G3WI48_9BACT|nr:DUF6694 family lipoprotein [Endomicrobium proavitum]AKL98366.1 conserved exported protein of unknown function [Endomicrobium proavitum]
MKKLFLCAVCAIFLFACSNGFGGQPKIDASSIESITTSLNAIRASLPEEKKEAFEGALIATIFYAVMTDLGNSTAGQKEKTEEEVLQIYKKYLNGKTADQIIVQAEELQEKPGLNK